MTGNVIEFRPRRGLAADPATLVRTARGSLSRDDFAVALSSLLGWSVGRGMIRAWETGVPPPQDVLAACQAGTVRDASQASPSVQAAGATPSAEAQTAHAGNAMMPPCRAIVPADVGDLTAWITATNTSDEAIGHIERVAAALAELHTQVPDRKVLADVMQLHRTCQVLLRGGRQRLRQTRELVRLDGDVLAHASVLLSNLGDNRSAEQYGHAALLYLQEADASQATAWYALAKTARWERNYAAAADLARRGLEHAIEHGEFTPMTVQLASYEANAAALVGDRARARGALARAESIAERLPPDDGELSPWSFPPGRQAIFRLSVLLRTGDLGGALRAAATAEGNWAAGSPRNKWTWAQVRIGAAIAHLFQGSLDGSVEQVAPVLALAPEMRIATVTGWLIDLDRELAQSGCGASQLGVSLRQEIREFIAGALREAG
jgi:tetratricopeptide (TPR) repeat protein